MDLSGDESVFTFIEIDSEQTKIVVSAHAAHVINGTHCVTRSFPVKGITSGILNNSSYSRAMVQKVKALNLEKKINSNH